MSIIDADSFLNTICDLTSIEKTALSAFHNGNFGELFVEYKEDEILKVENGIVQTPDFNFKRGFGLRSFKQEVSKYSYSSELDISAVKNALNVVGAGENSCCIKIESNETNLYSSSRFINSITLETKINFLKDLDAYARSKNQNIKQVVAVLAGSWQVVCIINESGQKTCDIRPLVRLSVTIVIEKNGVLESGMYSEGGRYGYESFMDENTKKRFVDESLRQALIKIEAIKAPVGEMPVVLGNGWTGILLHEAIGHGLEGDAIRKKTSAFHDLLGETIVSKNVTVVDDGTIENRRGSINIDDEGSMSCRTTLIENGRLVGFMQDRMNALLMNSKVTGNGRRESYENMPIPRMTNTFMLGGEYTFDEMVSKVKFGIFAKSFSDGQVDVTSGKFVFSASEAYMIENGRITTPVKGAMLIGDGASILKKISMIGNDFSLDTGVGTCGKDGQLVPVGVGQPSILIDKITVGGANL